MSALRSRCLPLTALLAALALSACGGGEDNGGVFVNSMTATTAALTRPMSISLSGNGLDKGVKVTVDRGCGEVTEASGGDAFTRRFTCTVSDMGPMVVKAYTANNVEVARLQVTVPQPEVTLTLLGVTANATSTVVLQLDPEKAPLSVKNFLGYVNSGFYRGTIFHRIIKDFVVQGGGYTPGTASPTLKNPTSPAIKLESNNGLLNVKGSLAMARTGEPDSATSQFYINTVDNPSLDYKSAAEPGYAVFGKVITGLDVIEQMNLVSTKVDAASGLLNLPEANITILLASQTK